jgi:uncharacterized protein (DUF2235 family)
MPRNLVICCDGTANEFAVDRTNVVKLYYTLEHDSPTQIAFYSPGLGTMEPAGALTTAARKVTRLLGMAIGYGLADDIRDAYSFLMDHYREGDRVFLFGFSRGAYTVRAVCSLLKMYGLLRPGNGPLVPYAIRMMMAIERARLRKAAGSDPAAQRQAIASYFKLAGEFRGTMSRTGCAPHFVGIWDSVSSIGWKDTPLKLPFVSDNPDIAIGRHAMAIDERRAFFRTHRWIPSKDLPEHGPRDLKQVWFPGVHADVGGGYPEAESGLSKIALEWMIEEAKMAHLQVDEGRQKEVLGTLPGSTYAKPDPDAEMHESLKGAWRLAEWVRKPHYDWKTGETRMRCNRGRRRTIPAGALVHESAFLRHGGGYAKRLPATTVRTPTVYASSQARSAAP